MEIEYGIDHCDEIVMKRFQVLVKKLELDKNSYTISHCRDFVNGNFATTNLSNRQIKRLLLSH